MHLLSLAFQWNKIKIICANFERFRHPIEKLIIQEFINNYKQTCNFTKFRSFAFQTMISMKIYRKPINTLLKRLQNGQIHSRTESKLRHEPSKSSNTDVFFASWWFRYLRLRVKNKCKRPWLGGLLHRPGVSDYLPTYPGVTRDLQ